MRDRQCAVGEADQEHRVPLESLRRVQRRQRDALHHRRMPRVGALTQLGHQRAQVEERAQRHLLGDEVGQRRQRLPALAGLGTRGRLGGEPERLQQLANHGGQVGTDRVLRRARRRVAARAAPAGSPGG